MVSKVSTGDVLWGSLSTVVSPFEGRELGAQRRNLRFQGLELVAPDEVELGGEAVGLGAESGFRLLARRLGETHGVGGELGEFIEQGISAVHGVSRRKKRVRLTTSIGGPGRKRDRRPRFLHKRPISQALQSR